MEMKLRDFPAPGSSIYDRHYIASSIPAEGGVARHEVHAARSITLVPAGTTFETASTVSIPETSDLTIFGNEVIVRGRLHAPGRTVKIVCRRLVFQRPTDEASSGIDVSGIAGDGQTSKIVSKGDGASGTEKNMAGNPAPHGDDGGRGGDGHKGGQIEICCETLHRGPRLILDARGGEGGTGGNGQPGGNGGDGFNTTELAQHKVRFDATAGVGGQGGCGGHGGDGGAGGEGGTIVLKFRRIEDPDSTMILSVAGGKGGNGGSPGRPGKGGSGSSLMREHKPLHGPASGGGGISGQPGYGGRAGMSGSITVEYPDMPWVTGKTGYEDTTTCIHRFWGHWSQMADLWGAPKSDQGEMNANGADGEDLPAADRVAKPGIPGHGAPYSDDWNGAIGSPPAKHPHEKSAREVTPPCPVGLGYFGSVPLWGERGETVPRPGSHGKAVILTPQAFADANDLHHLRMVYEYCRERYLFTNVAVETVGDDAAVRELLDTTAWLVFLADMKDPKGLSFGAANTLQNLRDLRNVFGYPPDFVALSPLETFTKNLKNMVGLYAALDRTEADVETAVKQDWERKSFLTVLQSSQDTALAQLKRAKDDLIQANKVVLSQLRVLDTARDDKAAALQKKFTDLKIDITLACGMRADEFFSALGQMAFMNLQEGHRALIAPLVAGNVGTLMTKAINDITTDTGQSVEKAYVISKLTNLAANVKTFAALKETRDGLLREHPGEIHRLLATSEQVRDMCENFYTYPRARDLKGSFDDFINTIETRSATIDEYNVNIRTLGDVLAQIRVVQQDKQVAGGFALKDAAPDLTALATFTCELTRHARERCLEQIYMGSRALALKWLDLSEMFFVIVERARASGRANSELFNAALLELEAKDLELGSKRRTNVEVFGDVATPCVRVELQNDLQIRALRHGRAATFRLEAPLAADSLQGEAAGLGASAGTGIAVSSHARVRPRVVIDPSLDVPTGNPFARKANIRLRAIRVLGIGLRTPTVFRLTHPGIEDFVTADDKLVSVTHQSFLHEYTYDPRTSAPRRGDIVPDRQMIGPFCHWTLQTDPKAGTVDLSALEKIVLEFDGTYEPFLM
jgi:hypothetical protein